MPDTLVRQLSRLPLVFDPVVQCPAGVPIAEAPQGSGCRCRVEHSSILAASDPSSLQSFCLNRYDECPTWQFAKERAWQSKALGLAD